MTTKIYLTILCATLMISGKYLIDGRNFSCISHSKNAVLFTASRPSLAAILKRERSTRANLLICTRRGVRGPFIPTNCRWVSEDGGPFKAKRNGRIFQNVSRTFIPEIICCSIRTLTQISGIIGRMESAPIWFRNSIFGRSFFGEGVGVEDLLLVGNFVFPNSLKHLAIAGRRKGVGHFRKGLIYFEFHDINHM